MFKCGENLAFLKIKYTYRREENKMERFTFKDLQKYL